MCGVNRFSKVLNCKDHYVSGEIFEIVECEKCKMRITKDFPAENELGKYYETSDYISHSDTKKGIMNYTYHQVRQYMLRKKAAWIEQYAGLKTGRMLDVGAGTGYFADAMQRRGWQVSVVEKNDSAREFAGRNFQLPVYDSIENFSRKNSSGAINGLDTITLWHVLEHLEHLNESMEQFYKLLKPGGTLIIAVPNCDSYDARKYGKFWAAYDVPRHIWHFRAEQMKILARKHGFSISGIKKMPFDAFYISMMSEKYAGKSLPFLRGILSGLGGYFSSLSDESSSSSLVYFLKKD